jgi:hypothetical protein
VTVTWSTLVIGAGLATGAALVDWDAGAGGGDCAARHSESDAAKSSAQNVALSEDRRMGCTLKVGEKGYLTILTQPNGIPRRRL